MWIRGSVRHGCRYADEYSQVSAVALACDT
ncbi:hypothetical protein FHT76_005123 [Rhizobium sp. BK176]|nr:hypothetical protein [Rhizobium sp. BK399]MCS3741274.1 hypothetical protein [Rhizobium sp. BK661]MCS4093438.1 hypothetical protein [Rhizobium sp. BK176]